MGNLRNIENIENDLAYTCNVDFLNFLKGFYIMKMLDSVSSPVNVESLEDKVNGLREKATLDFDALLDEAINFCNADKMLKGYLTA